MTAPDNLYDILGVPHSASETEVRRAYRNLVTRVHPDKGGDADHFRRIQHAFEVLSDAKKRQVYDETGRVERGVGEQFMDGFAGGSFRDQMKAAERRAAAASMADQIALRQSVDFQSHSAKFEAWMRARGGPGAAEVVTAESLAEQLGVVRGSYDAVPLPPSSPVAMVKCHGACSPDELKVTAEALPAELAWGEVLVEMQYAAINPADIYSARLGGVYGTESTTAPFVCGHDGVGIVHKVGPGVKGLHEGDWVLPSRTFLGTWRQRAVWREKDLVKVPQGGLPLEQLAMCREMVVAYRLLEDHGSLKPGDCVILNAATSTVGQCTLQLCSLLKLRAVAVVRALGGQAGEDRTRAALKALGASEVLLDNGSLKTQLDSIKFFAKPKLALDAVGGDSAIRLADTLQEGGELVIYGCLSGKPPTWPWQQWVFRGLKVSGFNQRKWAAANRGRMLKALEALGALHRGGLLAINHTEYDLETEFEEALEHALEAGRQTKVLLRCNGLPPSPGRADRVDSDTAGSTSSE